MISVALERMQKQAQEKQGWILEETAASLPHFFSEQHEGLRLERNFSQGPFLLRTPDNKRLIAVDVLSTTGGHAYFRHRLNNPLEKLRKASGWSAILCTDLLRHKHTAIVFWPIHASASGGVDEALLDNIKGSMRALVLRQLPRMTATHKMDYYSIALLSDKSLDANLGSEEVRAIRLGIGVTEWSSNINFLANLLKELFDEVVK